MMRSVSGASPVISRSIQISRFASWAIVEARRMRASFSHMTSASFTLVFVIALAAMVATRLWLAQRQIGFVTAHRNAVPPPFASSIELVAHRKAADYTVAKQRLHRIETIVEAILLLAMTIGSGLALLFAWTQRVDASPLWRDILLLAGVALVSGVVGLP